MGDNAGSNAYPTVNLTGHITGSVLDRQNYAGPSTFLDNSTVSTGYTGASGDYNAQIRAEQTSSVTGTTTYIFFTLTPDPGYNIAITGIKFGSRSTTSGPQNYSVRSSQDNYTTDIATGTLLNNSNWVLREHTGLSINSNAPITFRIYGYGGSGTMPPVGTPNWKIDDIFFAAASVLPIRFGDVSVHRANSVNNINWTNLTESNMLHYSVEYSTNGKDFKEIAKVSPVKNDLGPASYSYTHSSAQTDNSFYRIKGVELSGTTLYSNIVTVSSLSTSGSAKLYPNPAVNGNTALRIGSLEKGTYEIDIVNIAGQTVYKRTLSHGGGGIYIPLRLPYIAGRYTVALKGKHTQIIKTVLVDGR